ncbi:hypothetical protein psyc5s11_29850 [Clostridium gelidum]|uniref:BIG2 domain-containing protein n=1 Tax=Clostridium gelidum TaxID=704125 RepID=A0ABM7T7L8_9CLOT|nr:Ig-like domain-containing protein [Clostridium gelidum]BCZ46918.1 hypothetical protein psyc5s11_29850 [Clostridium gelidum]
MKNYFKKFSIMFVMLLVVIGVGVIQNGTMANAATVGQQLTQAEDGWRRFDDSDSKIIYGSQMKAGPFDSAYQKTVHENGSFGGNIDSKTTIKFYGTKFRIISRKYRSGISPQSSKNVSINLDGTLIDSYNMLNSKDEYASQCIMYEKIGLSLGIHTIILNPEDKLECEIDAIDIDSTGYLVDPNKSISLDKSSLSLIVSDSQNLTATTTPSAVGVTWISSDESIATVDSSGKVTAIKEGQATITAQIIGSETKATCEVAVTKSETTDPATPTEPTTGDANLFIELVDGQIKSYNLSSTEITKFKQWYLDRDNTKSNKPYYEFSKGDYKDYVIHEKIDWFEVR